MTVKVFRLVTGEDIISQVKETLQETDKVTLKDPAQIVLQRQGEQVGVAIAPFLPLIGSDIIINKHAIVAEGSPDQQLENEYNVKFGSGIVVASSIPKM